MSTLLEYTFLPNAVFIDTKNNLVLEIENPVDKPPVKFKSGRGGDIISIGFLAGQKQDDLVTDLNFSAKIAPDSFSISTNFDITSNDDIVLNPGDSIRVTFEEMPINDASGDSVVTITESIGESSGTYPITIAKKKHELEVIAWLDPLIVGLGQQSTLHFKSSSSTKVVISGYPDGLGEKTVDTPPYSWSGSVGIGSSSESQRTYTVIAWAGGNRSPQEEVTLTQKPPVITAFAPEGDQTIKPNDTATITWQAMYASGNTMKFLETRLNNVSSPFKPVPGKDLTDAYNPNKHNAEFMPDTVTYSLIVDGFKKSAEQSFAYKVMPVQLNYLKYQDESLTAIIYSYDPSDWGAVNRAFGNEALTLTIYQPGYKKDVFYLSKDDDTNPMIQYFEIVDGKLSWVTANLKSLTLNPGAISIDAEEIKKGTHPIPDGASQVILTGVGNNGNPIRSVLNIEDSLNKEKH